MSPARLDLSRAAILAFRRRLGALDERLPRSATSLRRAAWAGLQDSMPKAALLSIHARVEGTEPSTWEHPSLVQLWGPRHSVFVVAAHDLAVFSLALLPEDPRQRRRAEEFAAAVRRTVGETPTPYREVGLTLGVNPNLLRYASPTGTVLLRWDGTRAPFVWSVPAPAADPAEARAELARRYLRVYGPTTSLSFSGWSGIRPQRAASVFEALSAELVPVRTPVGDAWILTDDEPIARATPSAPATARLLPSGDAFFLLHGGDRELLVPDASHRRLLWTPRVWPGAVMVGGEIAGTWRRSARTLTVQAWTRLSRAARAAVGEEASSLPLPGAGDVVVQWEE